jgi:hypothetical protein
VNLLLNRSGATLMGVAPDHARRSAHVVMSRLEFEEAKFDMARC